MFCFQCEQTAKGTGCTKVGVCGKESDVAVLQDLLVHAAKGVSMYAHRAAQLGERDKDIDVFVAEALFSTVTNVNFDTNRLADLLSRARLIKTKARALYEHALAKAGDSPEDLSGPAEWEPANDLAGLISQGEKVGVESRKAIFGDNVAGLMELVTSGLKGMAAYVDHAMILGYEDEKVYEFMHEALDFMSRDKIETKEILALALRCGEMNLRAMELLDNGNRKAFGTPVPTKVRIEPVKGKAILVSGHDFKDLAGLLAQTEGKGINVYTHGEMLPAHGYPGLRKYNHLVGNYGGAWQNQRREFEEFPGAILMTTNCIQKPQESYVKRIFTSGLVAWPGVTHVENTDFTPVIDAALAEEGFAENGVDRTITVGFARESVLDAADKIVEAVKAGSIRHFFLIGGCDGAKSGRNYYTEFAEAVPKDCVILTLACGKYRFNKLEFGDIGGIPRLLDVGQCNDAYSAVQIAAALAEAFDTDVNSLPLSLILSWYEQKAVCILLTLLFLGIKKIKLGPSLPACLTPAVLDILVKNYEIAPIKTPAEDLKEILG